MSVVNLAKLVRPNTVTVFLQDPTTIGKINAFVLTNTVIPDPTRMRLDLMQSVSVSRRVAATRSPVERAVTDNIRLEPVSFSVQGSMSATPLGLLASILGTAGSVVRRDLREMKKLRKFQALRMPVAVVTPFEIFPSMAMSIDEVHDGSNKVDVTLSFEEIVIISPLSVAGVLDLDTLVAGAGSTADLGSTSTDAVTAPADLGAGGLGG